MVNIEMIQKAIAAHANWKARLRTAVETGKFEVTVAIAKANDRCEFGKWLHGPDFSAAQKKSEDYRTVVDLHAKFHQEAAKILVLATSGRTNEADEALGLLGSYTKASKALMKQLVEWRVGLH